MWFCVLQCSYSGPSQIVTFSNYGEVHSRPHTQVWQNARRQTADWVMKHLNVECTSVHVVYLLHRDETTSSRNQPLQRDATYQRGKLGVHTEASFMKSCQKSFLKMPELRDCYCKVSTGWTFSRASCTFMVHYLIHASQSLDWFFRVDSFKP